MNVWANPAGRARESCLSLIPLGYAKTRPARCRGMYPHTFLFHLKGCEFRFNHRGQDLYHVLLNLCRRRPLS